MYLKYSGLQSVFKDSQGYTEKHCLKKPERERERERERGKEKRKEEN